MTKMPPKKAAGAAAPSKKTEQKKKEKVIEVGIFPPPNIYNPFLCTNHLVGQNVRFEE